MIKDYSLEMDKLSISVLFLYLSLILINTLVISGGTRYRFLDEIHTHKRYNRIFNF